MADSTVDDAVSRDSEVSSTQISDGYIYGSQAYPSEDYLSAHPEAPHPPLRPPGVDVHHRSGRNDYADFAAALVRESMTPDLKPSSNSED